MNDLRMQYLRYKAEIDLGIQRVIDSTQFIGGGEVKQLEQKLSEFSSVKHVITCANGTDALQIALMALNLKPGDEVITTTFSFAATAEVINLLRLTPVFIDIDPKTFGMDMTKLEAAITTSTRCIIPVHLFGQCADMENLMTIANKHNIPVIEDNAQSFGTKYKFSNGMVKYAGSIGNIGTTSFFPSKNLGCFGDGGALFTNDDLLAELIRKICNHGTNRKYFHEITGVNSRLDAMQAAVLLTKLSHLEEDLESRKQVAAWYDERLENYTNIERPYKDSGSDHTFNQYTIKVKIDRASLIIKLNEHQIASAIYYPVSLHQQAAFQNGKTPSDGCPVSEQVSEQVLSLPIYPDMNYEQVKYVASCL